MRPVRRGPSPIEQDYVNYRDAFADLIASIGRYCSYCERPMLTSLAVEHIQPKDGEFGDASLIGRWTNFLLACVNCNSTKGKKRVEPAELLLPDRDNTFIAYEYMQSGEIEVSSQLSERQQQMAAKLLDLVGLNKRLSVTDVERQIYLDRVSQRMETWGIAQLSRMHLAQQSDNELLKVQIVKTAQSHGFFSIWMQVFDDLPEMKIRFIEAFEGTLASECFDHYGQPISPGPNPDGLSSGSKV